MKWSETRQTITIKYSFYRFSLHLLNYCSKINKYVNE